mmetsp:Transcript_13788/g.32619  ORF Transcript_13788/g.32619 Transcript_13788/m.32619 type:complete len:116 (+) Transcript_13788:254-601(+)
MQVDTDGAAVWLEGGGPLAGSCRPVLSSLRRLVHRHGVSLRDAVMMCCTSPARVANLSHVGTIDVGMRADMLLLDEGLELRHTMIGGECVYTASKRHSPDEQPHETNPKTTKSEP